VGRPGGDSGSPGTHRPPHDSERENPERKRKEEPLSPAAENLPPERGGRPLDGSPHDDRVSPTSPTFPRWRNPREGQGREWEDLDETERAEVTSLMLEVLEADGSEPSAAD